MAEGDLMHEEDTRELNPDIVQTAATWAVKGNKSPEEALRRYLADLPLYFSEVRFNLYLKAVTEEVEARMPVEEGDQAAA